jgi:hypothetical protein
MGEEVQVVGQRDSLLNPNAGHREARKGKLRIRLEWQSKQQAAATFQRNWDRCYYDFLKIFSPKEKIGEKFGVFDSEQS